MAVYALVDQDTRKVYVGKTARGNEYNCYKEHVRYRKKETAGFFRECDKTGVYPKMYLLTEVVATQQDTYRYIVAWTGYFIDHGAESLSYPLTQKYVRDMLPETQKIYDRIKDIPLKDMLDESKVLVARYKKIDKTAPRTPKNEIKISVSHEEYTFILRRAESRKMSMSRYCKNMALEGRIMTLDSPQIYEYLAELRGARNILRKILYVIYNSGTYYPEDLEHIQKMVDQILETEERVSEAYRENTKLIFKLLPK